MFEWDEGNLEHIVRHNVSREEAEQVLMNEPSELEMPNVDGEQRVSSIGVTDRGRWLLVISTVR
jgi:uncharacterized DUF497 family protein